MNTRPYKPYQLVLVDMGEYQYVGEVMSFITPGQTFMVRKVPGTPTTLVELPESKLIKVLDPRIKRYIHYAYVKCVDGMPTAFPIDMLRREVAAPANFDPETVEVDKTFGDDGRMVVGKLTTSHNAQWNFERWLSFGWECTHALTERLVQL